MGLSIRDLVRKHRPVLPEGPGQYGGRKNSRTRPPCASTHSCTRRLRCTLGFARKVYGEIAGLVNDRGHMRRVLSDKEQLERRAFAQEESGSGYVREELGG